MKDYSKVGDRLWTGKTGKALRGDPLAQVLMVYLLTSPHRNMLGLYHCPLLYMAHDTGLDRDSEGNARGIEGASEALERLCEAGFCDFDAHNEVVWIFNMARDQVGESLKESDKRVAGIQNLYDDVPNCAFLGDFFDRYGDAYHMTRRRPNDPEGKPLSRAFKAPSKPVAVTAAVAVTETAAVQPCSELSDEDGDTAPEDPGEEEPEVLDGYGHELRNIEFTDDDPEVFAYYPTKSLSEPAYPITHEQVAKYRELFPDVDVSEELRHLGQWCEDNPSNRKTYRGIPAHLGRCLKRKQTQAKRYQELLQERERKRGTGASGLPSPQDTNAWVALGREMGVNAKPGEDMATFRSRVLEAKNRSEPARSATG